MMAAQSETPSNAETPDATAPEPGRLHRLVLAGTQRLRALARRAAAPFAAALARLRGLLRRASPSPATPAPPESAPEQTPPAAARRPSTGSADPPPEAAPPRVGTGLARQLGIAAGIAALVGIAGGAAVAWVKMKNELALSNAEITRLQDEVGAKDMQAIRLGKKLKQNEAGGAAPAAEVSGDSPPAAGSVVEWTTAPAPRPAGDPGAGAQARAPLSGDCNVQGKGAAEKLVRCIEEFNRATR